jgi:hypothetical protein
MVLVDGAHYDALTAALERANGLLRAMRAHLTESHGPEDYVCVACGVVSHDGSKHDENCEVEEADAYLKGGSDGTA